MDALDFLHSVWGPQGEGFAFLSLRENSHSWRDLAFKYGGIGGDELELPNAALGDVYFCPNLFSRPRRRKELVLPTCWLYADLDEVTPDQVVALMGEEYRPAPVWESSPDRFQGMWHIDKHLEPEMHSVVNRKLTYRLGADKGGWDLTQVLRVPGTINHKYAEKPEVKLLWA